MTATFTSSLDPDDIAKDPQPRPTHTTRPRDPQKPFSGLQFSAMSYGTSPPLMIFTINEWDIPLLGISLSDWQRDLCKIDPAIGEWHLCRLHYPGVSLPFTDEAHVLTQAIEVP